MNRLTKRRRNPGRLFIQVQDVMNVMGYAKTAAYQRLHTIKAAYGKLPHQRVTVKEFAEYEGIPIAEVRKRMQ